MSETVNGSVNGAVNAATMRLLSSEMGIGAHSVSRVTEAVDSLDPVFAVYRETALHNQLKVIAAMQRENISPRHFAPTSGYGYDDAGRDALSRVFARVFGCEDALVRPQFASGTHAIATMLFGLLLPGDEMISATGRPYDTLQTTLNGASPLSFPAQGIAYREIPLDEDGKMDVNALQSAITPKTRIVYFQRSRGYAWREAISLQDMRKAFDVARACKNDIILAVDNCYGEFVNTAEPTELGADVMAGSLIKNPGGGLASTGGYIAGKRELIARIAERMTAPGIGAEVGSYAAGYTPFFQGLFLAPHVVCESLCTASLIARTFETLGYDALPHSDAARSDIVQAIRLGTPERLRAFCRSVQRCAPVDSMAVPEPWDMPGYKNAVIMAAGTFVQGASIELSADGPMIPPYIAYFQGGLTFEHGKLAAMAAIEDIGNL